MGKRGALLIVIFAILYYALPIVYAPMDVPLLDIPGSNGGDSSNTNSDQANNSVNNNEQPDNNENSANLNQNNPDTENTQDNVYSNLVSGQQLSDSAGLDSLNQDLQSCSSELKNVKDELAKIKETVQNIENSISNNETPAPSGNIPNNLTMIISFSALLILAFVLVVMYIRLDKKVKIGKVPKPQKPANYPAGNTGNASASYMLNRMRNYIYDNIRRGYSHELLRQSLLRQGYKTSDIDSAFKSLRIR
jgi:hypothetical protein